MKKLYRLKSDRKVAGVCSGIGQYFNIDPTIIRLLWVMSIFCFGGGIIAYILAIIIIPVEPDNYIEKI